MIEAAAPSGSIARSYTVNPHNPIVQAPISHVYMEFAHGTPDEKIITFLANHQYPHPEIDVAEYISLNIYRYRMLKGQGILNPEGWVGKSD